MSTTFLIPEYSREYTVDRPPALTPSVPRIFYRSRPREAASRATPRERLPPDLSAPSGRVIGIRSGSKALASALHLEAELVPNSRLLALAAAAVRIRMEILGTQNEERSGREPSPVSTKSAPEKISICGARTRAES